MRVVHVIPSVNRKDGGPTTALLGLACAQVKAGVSVDVVATFRTGDNPDILRAFETRGVRVHPVGPVRGKLGRHPQLASIVEQNVAGADIVHIHAVWEEILHQAARSAQRHQIPYIIRPCGMLDPWSLHRWRYFKKGLLAWRIRENLNHADALHCTSETEVAGVKELQFKPKCILEPNGIDLAEFKTLPVPGAFASRYPQLRNRKYLLILSRLHPVKGLDLLIPAFAQIAAMPELSDWMLVISGPATAGYGETLEHLVEQHKVGGRVIFTGMLTGQDRISALSDASLFALPSRHENFGVSVVEALATATPVIISDQVNIHSEITAWGVGQVVPLSEAALTDALRRWMCDEPLREAAGQRGRIFALERYNWDNIAQDWRHQYASVMNHFSRASASISTLARASQV